MDNEERLYLFAIVIAAIVLIIFTIASSYGEVTY